jgi:hypothetical protein
VTDHRHGGAGWLWVLTLVPWSAELIHAVKVVAAGDALRAPSVTRRLIADFTRKLPAVTPSPAALDILTSRETEKARHLFARRSSTPHVSHPSYPCGGIPSSRRMHRLPHSSRREIAAG